MNSQLPSRRLALAGAFATIALAGCSSSSGSKGSGDPSKRLKAAQSKLGSTSGYHVKLTSKGTPDQESSLAAGEGDVVPSPSSFKGTVTANTGGNHIKADVVGIGNDSWVKTPSMRSFMKVDLGDMGVPQPGKLFSTQSGFPALLTASTDMKESGEKLVDGEKVTIFKGTVEGGTVTKALDFGKDRSVYTVEAGLNGSDELRTMTITGPFFASADATYTLDFSKYGQKVSITKPE